MYPAYSPYQQPYQPYTPPSGSQLVRVTGYEGARAFASRMAPNSSAAVFDGGCDRFYVVTTDGAGFPSIDTYAFTPVETSVRPEQPADVYVTRKEFDELLESLGVADGK